MNLSVEYVKLSIIESGKDIGSKEEYQAFNQFVKTFDSAKEASEWLREIYGNHKKEKMYIDDKNGNAHHIGFTFGFRNKDISHNSNWWLQRDWIEIRRITETSIDMKHILREA